jgi:2-hydroxycyclohexanecarboxyl-CoA dehydrogenase
MSMPNILSLEGRTALITGAGQGVGRTTALLFAQHGAETVIVNDFVADRAHAVVAEVEALGVRAIPLVGDVTDHVGIGRGTSEAIRLAGGLHILVNNAGNAGPNPETAGLAPFWQTGPEDWNRWLGTNLFGVLNVTHAAMPALMNSNDGSIVNVISDAGRVGEPYMAVYSAAKAAVAGFGRALARSTGGANVRVNAVSLASVRTPGVEALLADPDTVKQMLKSYMIRRLGEPEDAANMILFLASSASSWITGQTIPVNGGFSVSQ